MRGMVFIGDAVAHSVFPGLAVAFVIGGNLVFGGLIAGVITAVLVAIFSQNQKLREDSVIGIFFAGSFALGIVIISLASGYSGSIQDFLFGSIVGVSRGDIAQAHTPNEWIELEQLSECERFFGAILDWASAK